MADARREVGSIIDSVIYKMTFLSVSFPTILRAADLSILR